MSIGPIEGFAAIPSLSPGAGRFDARHAGVGSASQESAAPVSGTSPKQESSPTQNATSTYELQEDVVEVHLDPQIKNEVIIEYLDKAKNVILQVPSNEELNVERGIAQEFQQAEKLRAVTATEDEGEQRHGH